MKELVVSHPHEDQVHRGVDLGGVSEGSESRHCGEGCEHRTSVLHVQAPAW